MITLNPRWAPVDYCQFIQVRLQRVTGVAFDITNEVAIFGPEGLDRPRPYEGIIRTSSRNPRRKQWVTRVILRISHIPEL